MEIKTLIKSILSNEYTLKSRSKADENEVSLSLMVGSVRVANILIYIDIMYMHFDSRLGAQEWQKRKIRRHIRKNMINDAIKEGRIDLYDMESVGMNSNHANVYCVGKRIARIGQNERETRVTFDGDFIPTDEQKELIKAKLLKILAVVDINGIKEV